MVFRHLGGNLKKKYKKYKNAPSCKTVARTSAITLSNVMRSADIIMLLPDTETPNPHKPSRCSETEALTVKQSNLFHYLSSQYGMD